MARDEGRALAALAVRAARSGLGPLLEVGAYRGRSTLYLAAGLRAARPDGDLALYSLDHHHGSEEMQAGWPDHDVSLVDPRTGEQWTRSRRGARRSTRPTRRASSSASSGTRRASPATGRRRSASCSSTVGHGEEVAFGDYHGWSPHVAPGGLLVLHDVFPDPNEGGRPPYDCYREAIDSGGFVEDETAACGSLRVLVAIEARKQP